MDLTKFIKRHKLKVSPKVVTYCEEGLKIMNESRDIMHKRGHIDRMFSDLEKYTDKKPIKNANMEVLLTAICWHDTWKALNGSGGVVKSAYQQLFEGLLSVKIFKQKAKNKLAQEIIDQVAYAIRKHSAIQFLPTKTLEARILQDLDRLDKWSSERVKYVTLKYNQKSSPLIYLIFKLDMKLDSPNKLNLEVFESELEERQSNYF